MILLKIDNWPLCAGMARTVLDRKEQKLRKQLEKLEEQKKKIQEVEEALRKNEGNTWFVYLLFIIFNIFKKYDRTFFGTMSYLLKKVRYHTEKGTIIWKGTSLDKWITIKKYTLY